MNITNSMVMPFPAIEPIVIDIESLEKQIIKANNPESSAMFISV